MYLDGCRLQSFSLLKNVFEVLQQETHDYVHTTIGTQNKAPTNDPKHQCKPPIETPIPTSSPLPILLTHPHHRRSMTSPVAPTCPGNQHPRITHNTLDYVLLLFPPSTRQPHPPNKPPSPRTKHKTFRNSHQNDRPPPPLPPPPRDLRLRSSHRRRHDHHRWQLLAVRHGRRHPRADCACARYHRVWYAISPHRSPHCSKNERS